MQLTTPGERSDDMKIRSPAIRKVQLAFGTAILTLLMMGAISYRGIVDSNESDRWVRHTHEVLETLQDLSSAMDSMESGYRRFVSSGRESYVQSCRAHMSIARQDMAAVGNLTKTIACSRAGCRPSQDWRRQISSSPR